MSIKKVFISIPMNGQDAEQIKIDQQEIFDRFVDDNQTDDQYVLLDTVFDTLEIDESIETVSIYYLSKSIEQLSRADLVLFAPGWNTARGCRIEHKIAKDYDIPYIEL